MSRFEIMTGVVIGLVLSGIGYVHLQRRVVRSAEAAATADTKRVIAAEQTYAAANGGFFDDISRLCRSGPTCLGIGIPDYPEDEPEFLEPDLARPTPYRKDHYLREWTSWAQPSSRPDGVSSTSVLDYCYTSTPASWFVRDGASIAGTGAGRLEVNPQGETLPCPLFYPSVPLE